MFKLNLVPDASGYASTYGDQNITIPLDGGQSRTRADKVGAWKRVDVSWTLNPQQYAFWCAFYRSVVNFGALNFLCDLLSEDGSGPVEQECKFIGPASIPQQQGLTYVVKAQLEVKPIPFNPNDDIGLLVVIGQFGDEADTILDRLARLVNVTMPDNIGD